MKKKIVLSVLLGLLICLCVSCLCWLAYGVVEHIKLLQETLQMTNSQGIILQIITNIFWLVVEIIFISISIIIELLFLIKIIKKGEHR